MLVPEPKQPAATFIFGKTFLLPQGRAPALYCVNFERYVATVNFEDGAPFSCMRVYKYGICVKCTIHIRMPISSLLR